MFIFAKVQEGARTPERSGGDAGFDLFSTHDARILPGKVGRVHTGVYLDMSAAHNMRTDPICGFIKSRSSYAQKGLVVVGGVIDPTYVGEIIVLMMNTTVNAVNIPSGEKMAQMVFLKTVPIQGIKQVGSMPKTYRGEGGFGSTGNPHIIEEPSLVAQIETVNALVERAKQYVLKQKEIGKALDEALALDEEAHSDDVEPEEPGLALQEDQPPE